MFELITGLFALGIAAQVAFWIIVGVLFPVFWLWMLVDAALRRPEDYRGGSNEKVIWIVLMVFFQFVCLPYFIMVYRRASYSSCGTAGVASV